KTARTAVHYPPADLHEVASLVADLDHLGVKQASWCHESGLRLTSHVSTTPGTIHDTHDLDQRRRVGLPSICEKQGELPGPCDDLRDKGRGRVLRAWAKVDPKQKPAAHRQGRMHPLDLFGTEFRVRLIQLYPLHVHLLDDLAMMPLGPVGCHLLQP